MCGGYTRFCVKCGMCGKVEQRPIVGHGECPLCGHVNPPETGRCSKCGLPIPKSPGQSSEAETKEDVSS